MFRSVEEVLPQLKELLFPSIATVTVLSVDVNTARVRVDAQCTADGVACPVCVPDASKSSSLRLGLALVKGDSNQELRSRLDVVADFVWDHTTVTVPASLR